MKTECCNIIWKESYHNNSYWYIGEDLFKEVVRMQFHLSIVFFKQRTYLVDGIWDVRIFRHWIYIGVFLSYSIHFFKFWYLSFGNISILLKFLPFFISSNSKSILLLTRVPKCAAWKEMCYLRNINVIPVMEPWGRREDGFHYLYHFLCNLKRYVSVQVSSQRLIFILKTCRGPTGKLFRKFL